MTTKLVNGKEVKLKPVEVAERKKEYDLDAVRMKQEKLVEYKYKRKVEYPPIAEQLDVIMKWVAGENEITFTDDLKSIAMECMSVKAKHPKPKEGE